MTHHDEGHAGGNGTAKRLELARIKIFASTRRHRLSRVRIGIRVAMAGKVFDARKDAGREHRGRLGDNHVCDQLRIRAKGTRPDNRVLGVGKHVRNRREIDVKANFMQVGTYGRAHSLSLGHVSRASDGRHMGKGCDVEGWRVRNAGHKRPALLVHAEKHGNTSSNFRRETPRVREHLAKLPRRLDVLREAYDATNGQGGEGGLHGLAGFGHAIRARKLLGRHEEELGHLLLERHGSEDSLSD